MPKVIGAAVMAVGILCLCIFCASAMFLNVATDGETYFEIQTELEVSPGVEPDTMRELDMLLARYLAGDASAMDETELFNADEKLHMVDVFNIFGVVRTVKNAAFAISALLLIIVFYQRAKFSRFQLRVGIIVGLALFILPFAALGIWAAVDFSAAFRWMHETLFTNELWRMNYATDLMIRMLPQAFFARIGGMAAVRAGIAALAVPLIIFIGTIDFEKVARRG